MVKSNSVQTNLPRLCVLANVITNNSIKRINKPKPGVTFNIMAQENHNNFTKAIRTLKVPEYTIIFLDDILEQKGKKTNPFKVIQALHSLAYFISRSGNHPKIIELTDDVKFEEDEYKIAEDIVATTKAEIKKPALDRAPSIIIQRKVDPIKGLEGNTRGASFLVQKEPEVKSPHKEPPKSPHKEVERPKTPVLDSPKKVDVEVVKVEPIIIPEVAPIVVVKPVVVDDKKPVVKPHMENRKSVNPPVDLSTLPVDPTKCSLSITQDHLNLPAGEIAHFLINMCDKDGKKTMTSQAPHVELKGEPDTEVTVKNLKDGTWRVNYSCIYSGDYELIVKVGDVVIGGKILINCIECGTANPLACAIQELASISIPCGEPFVFKIQSRDDYGNKRIAGGDPFKAVIDEKEIELVDLKNGQYEGSFVTDIIGEYELVVTLNGTHIQRSPALFQMVEGSSDPNAAVVVFPQVDHVNAGEQVFLQIENCDKFGNKKNRGGEEVTIMIKGASEKASSLVTDLENGSYRIDFTFQKAGDAIVTVFLKGVAIKGFPYTFQVKNGLTNPSKTILAGDGLTKAISGKEAEFTIQTFDDFDNPTTGESIKVIFTNETKSFFPEVKQVESGTYKAVFTADVEHDSAFNTEIHVAGTNLFETKRNVLMVTANTLVLENLNKESLVEVKDHDLMVALWKHFKMEQIDSWIHKIEEIRERIIQQVKYNSEMESQVKQNEQIIDLLIMNRFKQTIKNNTNLRNELEMKQYGNLFYLLQTDPKYLAKALLVYPQDRFDEFLEMMSNSLFGYNFQPREEYLLLNLCKKTLQFELEKESQNVGEFLNGNPVFPRLMMGFGRRSQSRLYLQKVLFNKILAPILNMKSMDLELNPHKILNKFVAQQEEKGIKNTMDLSTISTMQVLEMEHIRTEIQLRSQILSEICNGILEEMTSTIDQMPYGLRYLCQAINDCLAQKHPKSKEIERLSIIGYILWYRFMNQVFILPDSFDLTKSQITSSLRANLLTVSKVLTQLTTVTTFDGKNEEHMYVMNEWLEKNQEKYFDFIKRVMQVESPETELKVDEYSELQLREQPKIRVRLNTLYTAHRELYKLLPQIAPEKKDALNLILSQMDKAKEILGNDENIEIILELSNQHKVSATLNIDLIFEKCVFLFKKILSILHENQIGQSVEQTLEVAKKISKEQSLEALGFLTQQFENCLPNLLEFNKISPQNKYREILDEISSHMNNTMKSEEEKKQYYRLADSYNHLQQYQRYLEEKVSDFDVYIKQSIKNDFKMTMEKGKPQKKHILSFAKLEKKGVIMEINVMTNMRKGVSFVIYMAEPGNFTIDAMVTNLVAKSIKESIQDLLLKKSKSQTKIEYGYVTFHLEKLIDFLNELFLT